MAGSKNDEGAAITAVGRALDLIDDADARARILDWASRKYGIPQRPLERKESDAGDRRGHPPTVDANTAPGDLFERADPQTDGDRILVVGYWLETAKGVEDFDSQSVNAQLKALGYGLANVNKKFDSVVAKRPQLVRQTSKSGKAKQARKKYRLTAEGKKRVAALLRGERPAGDAEKRE